MRNRTAPAKTFGLVGKSARKFLTTTALTAAGLAAMMGTAKAGNDPVGDYDVIELRNTQAAERSQGFVRYQSAGRIIDDAVQEDTGRLGHNVFDSPLTIIRGAEEGTMRHYGRTTSTGSLYFYDDNGILFGNGSTIDTVGNFGAFAGDVSVELGEDKVSFDIKTTEGAEIVNEEGSVISVGEAGIASFVGNNVINRGTIVAKMGSVVLASGEKVALDMFGDGLFELAVDGEAEKVLIENTGNIEAHGGQVLVTAGAAKDVVDNVINMDGVVDVSSVSVQGGKIILSGGEGHVKVSGKLNASGQQGGGDIQVTGKKVEITETAEITNDGDESNTFIFGTDKATHRGSVKAGGRDSTIEISGKELELGGAVTVGENGAIIFDPVIFNIGAAEAATIVGSITGSAFGAIISVGAEEEINVNAAIDTSGVANNNTLHFLDEGGVDGLTINLNDIITMGSNAYLTGDATIVNVAATGSVQNGINVATEAGGAVVNVASGTYFEEVNIDTSVSLLGTDATIQGPVSVIQTAAIPGTTLVNITADNSVFSGFTVDATGYSNAVGVDGADDVEVSANTISGHSDTGIWVQDSDGVLVGGYPKAMGNRVTGGTTGIKVRKSDNADVIFNVVRDQSEDGIRLKTTNEALLDYNVVSGQGGDSVVVRNSTNAIIQRTDIDNSGGDGISVNNSDNILLTMNNVKGAKNGIALRGTTVNSRAETNTILDSVVNGILVDGASGNTIGGYPKEKGNIVTGGENGIQIKDSDNDVIFNIVRDQSHYGIKLDSADGSFVDYNVVSGQGMAGVYAYDTEGATIQNTDVDDVLTGYGIFLEMSDNNLVVSNNVQDSLTGIRLDDSDMNRVQTNVLEDNTTGILLENGSDENTIGGTPKALGNIVTRGTTGIRVEDSVKNDLFFNIVRHQTGNGIELDEADFTHLDYNVVAYQGGNSVNIQDSDDVSVQRTDIDGSGENGIYADGSNNLWVEQNNVKVAGENGIFVENGTNIDIINNVVTETEEVGIKTSNTAGVSIALATFGAEAEDDVTITGNTVTDTGSDGIAIDYFANGTVSNNTVSQNGEAGIFADGYNDDESGYFGKTLDVEGNTVSETQGDGISVGYTDYVKILNNVLMNNGADAINNYNGTFSDISGNTADTTADDGIDVDTVANVTITGNTLTNIGLGEPGESEGPGGSIELIEELDVEEGYMGYGADAIHVSNVYGYNGGTDEGEFNSSVTHVTIQGNTIDTVVDDGIQVVNSGNAVIGGFGENETNFISNVGYKDGEYLEGEQDEFGADGIHVMGGLEDEGYNGGPSENYFGGGEFNPYFTTVDILNNTLDVIADNGIAVETFGETNIEGNMLTYTGGTSIDVFDGYIAKILNNTVSFAGFLPYGTLDKLSAEAELAQSFGTFETEAEADGIHVEQVGYSEDSVTDQSVLSELSILPPTSVTVEGNTISIVSDDGVRVEKAGSLSVVGNTVGHAGGDGINIDEVDYNTVEENSITMVEGNGISIQDGETASVKENRILLASMDGIQVRDIEGWVNAEGNEVAMTGQDGIQVGNSGNTSITGNNIFMAGMGEDLAEVIAQVNSFAAGTFLLPSFASVQEATASLVDSYFDWEWGNGRGINTDNIYFSGWTPQTYANYISGNTVKWTGGHGIYAGFSDTTEISGNTVSYAGIDHNTFEGHYDFFEMIDSGPFASADRRTLWENDDSMIDVLETYFGNEETSPEIDYVTISNLSYDEYDGIHAEYIFGDNEGADTVAFSEEFSEYGPAVYDLNIIGNTVSNSGDDGIEVDTVGSVLIKENTVSDSGTGAHDYDSYYDYTGADGIHVENVGNNSRLQTRSLGYLGGSIDPYYLVDISENTVSNSADDGVEVLYSGRTYIGDNAITNSGVSLVDVDPYYSTPDVTEYYDDYYYGNAFAGGFDGRGSDGIHVSNVFGDTYVPNDKGNIGVVSDSEEYSVVVSGNTVSNSADDGIQLVFTGNALIGGESEEQANIITNSGASDEEEMILVPVEAEISSTESVYSFTGSQDELGADGISVVNGFNSYNQSADSVSQEIYFPSNYFLSTRVDILGNDVSVSEDDGIESFYVTDLTVDGNTVDESGDDGIAVIGAAGFFTEGESSEIEETNILIGGSLELPYFEAIINGNVVDNSGGDGIESQNYDRTEVTANLVSNSGENGFFGSGPFHGEVFVDNNAFTDNVVGAKFESGEIDLTGEIGNTFVDGEIGLLFSPFDFSSLESDDGYMGGYLGGYLGASPAEEVFGPSTFPYTNLPTSGFAPLTLVDNDGPGSTPFPQFPTNFAGTIGNQTFINQSESFVRLEGNFYQEPFWLNGLDSTYFIPGEGFVTPADTNGILDAGEFSFLEDMFHHFPDDSGVGIFFFGFVPSIDEEDIFNVFDPANLGITGLNVTVTGPVAIPGAENLANITPFAGGEGEEVTPESLNAIETAAGEGEAAACWGDAMNLAQTGQVVNYSYGSSPNETIAAAAVCGSEL